MTSTQYTLKAATGIIGNLLVIKLEKGTNSASLIFDTGASMSVINKTSATLFDAKAIHKSVEGSGTANKRLQAQVVTIKDLKIGEYDLNEIEFIHVDDQVLNFGKDEQGNEMIIDGFLGWDIISKLKWTFDHKELIFSFNESIKDDSSRASMEEWDNMPIVRTNVNLKDCYFGLDTGHTESVLSKLMYSNYEDLETEKDTFTGIDGQSQEDVKVVSDFQLEISGKQVLLHNISLVNRELFPAERKDICGLLGYDVLEGYSWVLDYLNRRFELL